MAASFSSVLKILNSVSSGVNAAETSWATTSSPLAFVVPASPWEPASASDAASPTSIDFKALSSASRSLVKFRTTRRLEL